MATIFSKMGSWFSRKPVATVEDKFDPGTIKVIRKALQPNPASTRTALGGAAQQVQDYDLKAIDRFVDNESLAFQAFSKIEEKCVNGGYAIVSRDSEMAAYIRRRLRELSMVARKPVSIFIREIFQDLVKYSNCFLYKVRDAEMSSGNPVKNAGNSLDPIATYLRLDATSVTPERDDNGNIKKYVVGPNAQGGGGKTKNVRPEDIVHFYAYKNERNNVGTPFIWPVIDDLRVLRKMEENVEMLIHKHLFPLYQYIVGTEKMPSEPEEIEKIYNDIENMPTEGGFVTPERHHIEVLGAEGEAIDAAKYIEHFHNRVIEGLGIGATSFGLTSGASRAGAEVIDRGLVEKAKLYQDVFVAFFNEFVINELLQEGGYDIYSETEEIDARIQFAEIDMDSKIKKENHIINQFNNQAINYDEFRTQLGLDPLEVEGEEFQKLNFFLFGAAKLSEFAVAEAEAAVGARNAVKAADQPSNQHGTKMSPKRTRDFTDIRMSKTAPGSAKLRTSILDRYDACRSDVLKIIENAQFPMQMTQLNNLEMVFGVTESSIETTSKPHISQAFLEGFHSSGAKVAMDSRELADILDAKSDAVLDVHKGFVHKTMTNLRNDVMNTLGILDKTEVLKKASNIFDVRQFHIDHAAGTSIASAFNFGRMAGFLQQGYKKATLRASSKACDECKNMDGRVIVLEHVGPLDLPPHHVNCECSFDLTEDSNA